MTASIPMNNGSEGQSGKGTKRRLAKDFLCDTSKKELRVRRQETRTRKRYELF
jgi:hypothetical protein